MSNQTPDNITAASIDAAATRIVSELEQGKSLHEAAGITPSMQEEIYTIARDYYEQGKYVESLALFQMLARINPNAFRFIYGTAASFHQLKDYINASLGFFTAFTLEPLNPMPSFYLADCFINLDAPEDAIKYLDMTILVCDEDKRHQFDELKERCKLIKSSLEKEKITK